MHNRNSLQLRSPRFYCVDPLRCQMSHHQHLSKKLSLHFTSSQNRRTLMAGGSPIKFNALHANSRVTQSLSAAYHFAKGLRSTGWKLVYRNN